MTFTMLGCSFGQKYTFDDIMERKRYWKMKTIGHITVPPQINSPHKYTRNTQKYFEKITKKLNQVDKTNTLPDDYLYIVNSVYRGRIRCKQADCFHLTVAPENLERALIILDTLAKELEKYGFKFQSDKPDGIIVAIKDDEVLHFKISEGYKYHSLNASKKLSALERILYTDKKAFATGVLSISVNSSFAKIGKCWTDGKRLIEVELPSIINEFTSLVSRQKQARVDDFIRQELRDEEKKVFKESQSKRYLEQSVYDAAMRESVIFKAHIELENYLIFLENQFTEKYGELNDEAHAWLSSARKIAEEKNPVVRRLRLFITG